MSRLQSCAESIRPTSPGCSAPRVEHVIPCSFALQISDEDGVTAYLHEGGFFLSPSSAQKTSSPQFPLDGYTSSLFGYHPVWRSMSFVDLQPVHMDHGEWLPSTVQTTTRPPSKTFAMRAGPDHRNRNYLPISRLNTRS